jgi:uncharacterized YkwD family protein
MDGIFSLSRTRQLTSQAAKGVDIIVKKHFKKIAPLLAGTLVLGTVLTTGVASAAPYTVKDNDTMYYIAKAHGISLATIIRANPQVADPNIIWPGMVLNVPSASASQPQYQPGTAQSSYAEQVANLVNQERAKAGLQPLQMDASLSKMALDKAKDMYNNRYFDHNSPTYGSPFDMMNAYGIHYSYAGENIAMGQRSPQEVMNAWMNSQGHRENILNAHYHKIGVAYYNGEWVQEFTD